MELNLNNTIDLLCVFMSLLFSFFLLTTKSGNKLSNLLIALFLIANAQDIGAYFVSYFVYPKYPSLGMLISLTIFFKMPLMYLYIMSVIYEDFKIEKKDLIHLVPFVIMLIVFLPRYFFADFESKMAFLELDGSQRMPEIKFSYLLVHIQLLIYFVLSFLAIKKYKKLLLENYSNANMFHHQWLYRFLLILSVVAVIASVKNVFMFMDLENAHDYFVIVGNFLLLGFICWIVMRALQTPELFTGIHSNLQLVREINSRNTDPQFTKSTKEFQKPESSKEVLKLTNYLKEHKPYLNASLTLYELAKQLKMPSRDLSILINRDLNQHFFDFVNSFRINDAQELLKNPEKQELTVLEILYKVGFNSKSSFNTAFKKHVGMTPTQFRKASLSDS